MNCITNKFKVLYYPNCECHPLVLAKSILVFDEITFFDHPSLNFNRVGNVGHDSSMRQLQGLLNNEGFNLKVLKPNSGPVEGEIKNIIDVDLSNDNFRRTFLQLVHNDPSFIIPKGNYGKYGTAENLRQLIVNTKDSEIPRSCDEISSFKPKDGIPPEILIATKMAFDSYQFNLSMYYAINEELQLFGDSKGMDLLLNAKLNTKNNQQKIRDDISHKIAFTLLENIIPNEAFNGKTIVDIVHFRNKMSKERELFKERILEITSKIDTNVEGKDNIEKIIFGTIVPEVRNYQNMIADNWDNFFKKGTKVILNNTDQMAELIVATILSQSLITPLLATALKIGKEILPNLIDFLKEKEKINRTNPYLYLMKFN